MTALEVLNLTVEVDGYPVLNNLTLTVKEGEHIRITGDHNDAEAVLEVFSGQTLPVSGEVWIYNLPPRQAFQRGLICHTINTFESSPTVLAIDSLIPSSQKESFIIIRPTIGFPNKSIQKFHKFTKLIIERRDTIL
jgi:ABC-type branched-subunit amino acid transport system ATPase component